MAEDMVRVPSTMRMEIRTLDGGSMVSNAVKGPTPTPKLA